MATNEEDVQVLVSKKELDDLRKENAKLKQSVHDWKEAWHIQREIIGRLGLEKLERKLGLV